MNDSEKSVYEYLTSLGLGAVVYEPDGKVPPDFSESFIRIHAVSA